MEDQGVEEESDPLTRKGARLPGSFVSQTSPEAERRRGAGPPSTFVSCGLRSAPALASHWLRLARRRPLHRASWKAVSILGGKALGGKACPDGRSQLGEDLRPCLFNSEEQATSENYRFGEFPGLVEGKTPVLSPKMLRPAVNR